MQRHRRLTLAVTTLVAVAVAAWLVSPAVALATLDSVASQPVLYGLLIVVAAVVRPLVAWPTTLLAVAVGYGYGIAGLPFAVAVMTLTGLPPYWFGTATSDAGRVATLGKQFIEASGGVRGVAGARLLPVPSDVISVAAGVAGVRRRPYLLGTAVGELPWAVLGVLVGVSLERLHRGGMNGVVDPWLLVGMSGVAILLLAGPCYQLIGRRREESGAVSTE